MNKKQTEIPLAKRNNYFSGKLLSPEDLNDEQSYLRNRMRLHNQMLLRCGCISGLKVSTSRNKPTSIIVHAGIAIDPQGNEIVLSADVECALPKNSEITYLVAYWENGKLTLSLYKAQRVKAGKPCRHVWKSMRS